MATINLGSIKFNWKGAFNNSTAYAVDDVVSSGGNSYVCIQASQGNAVGNATAYWNIMSAAGAAGAEGGTSTLTTRGDLLTRGASAVARLAKGTVGQVLGQGANDPAWVNGSGKTLTTQGDLLYRDGSGLQRLAKGTAAKVLAMNSAANAPEWVTAGGGDCVKLGKVTISSDVGYVQIQGLFDDAVYSNYRLVFYGVSTTNDSSSSNLSIRMQTGSGYDDYTNGSYYSVNVSGTGTSGGDSQGGGRQYAANYWEFSYNNLEADVGRGLSGNLDLYMPKTSGKSLRVLGRNSSFHVETSNFYVNSYTGHIDSNSAVFTGLKIYPSGGNLDAGEFVLYGFKK